MRKKYHKNKQAYSNSDCITVDQIMCTKLYIYEHNSTFYRITLIHSTDSVFLMSASKLSEPVLKSDGGITSSLVQHPLLDFFAVPIRCYKFLIYINYNNLR